LTEKTRSLENPEEAARQRKVNSAAAAAAATTKLHDSQIRSINQEIKNKENKNGEQLLSRLVLFSSKQVKTPTDLSNSSPACIKKTLVWNRKSKTQIIEHVYVSFVYFIPCACTSGL
jgi:hypothetical protein